MPPRRRHLSDDPTKVEAQSRIQEKLSEALAIVEEAKRMADEAGLGFDFLDKTYVPSQTRTVTTGGGWDDEVDDDWNGSSC
jgi:hypothetical protein